MNACACMGPPPGEEYFYCVRKQRGMDTSYYQWTDEEKKALDAALAKFFQTNKESKS